MTQVTFEETQLVAQKAKLQLSDQQLKHIQKDLQSILQFADTLEKVKTDDMARNERGT